ncbi:unnamed protein product [Toxocara canis]|uniref:G_PROTEIN_RECEP_F1_2 domain-containing protein n=1 Tax=Toxocara canis TaxID=6265 RepID=A0A183VEG3_TOXCA|nr:unnamed protein product [Toxocara canis]
MLVERTSTITSNAQINQQGIRLGDSMKRRNKLAEYNDLMQSSFQYLRSCKDFKVGQQNASLGLEIPKRVKTNKSGIHVPTHVSASVAYTAIMFAMVSLSWWGPASMCHVFAMNAKLNSSDDISNPKKAHISCLISVFTTFFLPFAFTDKIDASKAVRSGYVQQQTSNEPGVLTVIGRRRQIAKQSDRAAN